MNAVRDTGVPESSVLGTSDRHEEKTIDSVIQYIYMLRRTVQVNVPRLITNQSEAFSGRCKLVLLR